MWIKLTYSLNGMHARSEIDLPANIEISAKTKIVFWYREVEHNNQIVRQFCCDAILECNCEERLIDFFRSLNQNHISPENIPHIVLPLRSLTKTIIDTSGKISPNNLVPWKVLPRFIQSFLDQKHKILSDLIRECVSTLRWAQCASGGHQPFGSISFKWSDDGTEWHRLPRNTQVSVIEASPLDTAAPAIEHFTNLVVGKTEEPLAHELMREAIELSRTTPRSSLLIAVSALEIGLKEYVSHLIPNSRLVMEKMQSPSILKLIMEVIPAIQHATRSQLTIEYFPLSDENKKYLQKWISQRNQIAHGPKDSVDSENLFEFLEFSRDLLYIIDFLTGHDWALKNLKSGKF
ncbi:hypothetical protein [Pseudohalocynthiibacter sp. F2068]|uniref:hypothetical protein n=1 Tax=Pseudohalocynthiibacter sp. F2068 TaxID=2926418 RepID=UPI001FF5B540|nr:hypothetical protein [Pseudohalocynthiibacter sp. F2068]